MKGTPMLQPMPREPLPDVDEYCSVNVGCAPARPGGTRSGSENVAAPVESTGEKLSPMPSVEPSALGIGIAVGVAALFAPVLSGSEATAGSRPSFVLGSLPARADSGATPAASSGSAGSAVVAGST